MNSRKSGILLPIFSLPDKYGIGTLGKKAYDFVKFLEQAKVSYWQILPIGPTSYGDSPYQSFSSYAGNPYFIDLDLLVKEGLLDEKDLTDQIDLSHTINYANLYNNRYKVLRKAFKNFKNFDKLTEFEKENPWVKDYALFMSIKDFENGKSFLEWEDDYKFKKEEVMEKFILEHEEDLKFYEFLQMEFFREWYDLKTFANEHGVKIIGDIPIYVALDSCDVWCNKEQFQLDENYTPKSVAGCPPDDFTELGQLWGNPLYDYKYMKKDHYSWWINRMKHNSKLFDVVRIDHFRGFEAYYAIPYGDKDATRGHWEKGPNTMLFNAIKKELGEIDIIAENLGFLTKEVDIMLEKLKYPGMKVLQFGFDPSANSDAIPHNLEKNMVVYTGTHDNNTSRGWYDSMSLEEQKFFNTYTGCTSVFEVVNAVIREALKSVANTAVIPMQDFLQLGSQARINTPSTLGGNWVWRMDEGDMNDDLASYIASLNKTYYR